ncbi:PilC beta-propeller domain-containing protein [Microbulbifer donghaiensis]|uniref:PilC beta-propeller domain-containing protein n=1 Tax=Microbulbifer donghaiensis TaxID=494016 RepID=A0A1M5HWE1_9GAMM|nr:PilC/PilY family type IV pilus protein [Microbulbifer donghaiensis]SHG20182.1 PilC beta-propeller domain-containing protein [Microbulbifer donghaiensis]
MKKTKQPNSNMNAILFAALGFSATLSTCVSAAEVDISDVPLTSVGKTQPNLMILLDSSANMGDIRLSEAAQAATDVVSRVQNMRVGVAQIGDVDDTGAHILRGLTSVNAEGTRQEAITKIGDVRDQGAGGAAPLAEALLSIGRYFVEGYDSAFLTLHPDGSAQTAIASEVLGTGPAYGSGVSEPNSEAPAIEQYCQKNFIVTLTAGLPSEDIDIAGNEYIRDYDRDCEGSDPACVFDMKGGVPYDDNRSDYLDDVALALNDINLRPGLVNPDDASHKNNVISYFVGFADEGEEGYQLLADAGRNGTGGTGEKGYWQISGAASLANAMSEIADTISSVAGSQSSVAFNSTSLEAGSVIYSARYDTADFSGRLFAHSLDPQTGRMVNTPLWEASQMLAGEGSSGRQIITLRGGTGVPFDFSSLYGSEQSYGISVNLNRLDINEATVSLMISGSPIASTSTGNTLSAITNDIDGDITVVCDNCSVSTQVQITSASIGGVEKTLTDVILTANGASYSLNSVSESVTATYTRHRLDLEKNAVADSRDDQWRSRLNYIRGDTTNEGADDFRRRGTIAGGSTNLLGDIVHSAPIYVGEPQLGLTVNNYQNFLNGKKDRTPMVYVGANDGMLHAFNASSGEEEFAYVPALLLNGERYKGLHALTSSAYSHKYYVDLTPTVSDVFADLDGTGSQWNTVLIGGLRGGGKGYFALNVTDPSEFTNAENNADDIVLWEFDGATNATDLGLGFSEAKIAQLNNGKWAAIFGNGYNSGNGMAGLFIIYIEDGVDGSWDPGDWKFISTNSGSSDTPNGLSTPRLVDLNGDGKVDRAYAGDLHGNMWAFDLCDAQNDGSCSSFDTDWSVDYSGNPLFSVGNGEANNAITAAPLVARNTSVQGGVLPNVLVMFGTGQYLNQGDLWDAAGGAFYVVWDKGNSALDTDDLVERALDTADGTRRISESTSGQIDWSTKYGWYMPLDDGAVSGAGERVVTSPALRNNTLFFNTIIPNAAPCASSGSGWLMSLDFRTGMPEADSVYPVTDFNNDGQISVADAGYVGKEYQPPPCLGDSCDDDVPPGMPGQSGFIGDVRCTPGSGGGVVCDDINVGKIQREGRLTWQELVAD